MCRVRRRVQPQGSIILSLTLYFCQKSFSRLKPVNIQKYNVQRMKIVKMMLRYMYVHIICRDMLTMNLFVARWVGMVYLEDKMKKMRLRWFGHKIKVYERGEKLDIVDVTKNRSSSKKYVGGRIDSAWHDALLTY